MPVLTGSLGWRSPAKRIHCTNSPELFPRETVELPEPGVDSGSAAAIADCLPFLKQALSPVRRMPANCFLTTAIDYTNGAPHIGHAYEKLLGDALARYHRMRGEKVFFLTGVDQHGQKVQASAAKEGVAPAEYAERVTALFLALWEKLDVQYDGWAATTDPRHHRVVRGILQRLHDEGQLYKGTYRGFYSVRQEQFLTDKELGADGLFGPEWGEVAELEEEGWYFRLLPHRDWLLGFLDTHPGWITPSFRQTELRHAVERLAGDLSISRPKSRLTWGIELPFDADCVTFVWFDALINYISFAGYGQEGDASLPDFDSLWPATHIIGKDILVPAHGIYWPIMLHALGFTDEQIPPLLVHGWWNIGGAKVSKSTGPIVDPLELAGRYGVEALRYYLLADIVTGKDADFDEDRLVLRYNTDLANSLGNLLNRTLNMAHKYRAGILRRTPAPAGPDPASHITACLAAWDEHRVSAALDSALAIATGCTQFIDAEKPWALAKDPAQGGRLDGVLYYLAESLRVLGVLLSPVLPQAAAGLRTQLLWPEVPAVANTGWGGLPDGHTLGLPVPLFPRIDAVVGG